jgi:hypothetical protein
MCRGQGYVCACGTLLFVAYLLLTGCGGSGMSMPASPTLSAAQAQSVTQQVLQAVQTAFTNAIPQTSQPAEDGHQSLSKSLATIHPDATSPGCTATSTGQSCNFPLSSTVQCSGGGNISVSGDISGSLSNSGSGMADAKITVTPANCGVSSVTFSGEPNITLSSQFSFSDNNGQIGVVFPITLSEGGGISFGPNASGTCQLNVTYSINSGSCSVTGTVCGQSVNGTC